MLTEVLSEAPVWLRLWLAIAIIAVVAKVLSLLGRTVDCWVDAVYQHAEAIRPIAYYEEYRGVYAVFLPSDTHHVFERARYKGFMTVVNPCLTFAPKSKFSGASERHTGQITDMVHLFEGWTLRHHDIGGAYFFVPCADTLRDEKDTEEQLRVCPLVRMDEARKILAAERARCAKTRLTTWYFFRSNLWLHWTN